MEEITLSDVKDEPGRVYIIGYRSYEISEAEASWLHGPFKDEWDNKFEHAELLLLPRPLGMMKIYETDAEEIKELMKDD